MLGKNIYNLRKKENLSQEQLAELIDVTRQTISNWELGETSPNPEQLKLLSKTLKVSVDDLLDNEIKAILEQKISNTERLAGIIIKILRVIGIFFFLLVVVDIISFILFVFVRKEVSVNEVSKITITCHENNNDYLISVGTDGYFNCSNCSSKIQSELKELVDYGNIENNEQIITKYFQNNNGTCE